MSAALCRICNLRTHTGLHYGVYSCEADKQFLKRTFHDMITYSICDMQCPPRSRGWCQYCRLRSSLLTGINLKMIRMGNNALKPKQGRAPRQKKPKAKAPKTSLKVDPMSEQDGSPTIELYHPASQPGNPTSLPSSVKEEVESTQAWSRPVTSHEVESTQAWSRPVTSHEVESTRAWSRPVTSHGVESTQAWSRPVTSHDVESTQAWNRPVTSHEVESTQAWSRPVTSHEVE